MNVAAPPYFIRVVVDPWVASDATIGTSVPSVSDCDTFTRVLATGRTDGSVGLLLARGTSSAGLLDIGRDCGRLQSVWVGIRTNQLPMDFFDIPGARQWLKQRSAEVTGLTPSTPVRSTPMGLYSIGAKFEWPDIESSPFIHQVLEPESIRRMWDVATALAAIDWEEFAPLGRFEVIDDHDDGDPFADEVV